MPILKQRPKGVFITSFKRAELLLDPRLLRRFPLSTSQHCSAPFFAD